MAIGVGWTHIGSGGGGGSSASLSFEIYSDAGHTTPTTTALYGQKVYIKAVTNLSTPDYYLYIDNGVVSRLTGTNATGEFEYTIDISGDINHIQVVAINGSGGVASGNIFDLTVTGFVSRWDTTKAGSASNTVTLPLRSAGTYSGTIDWGDGTTSVLSYANRTHVYSDTGIYDITITGTIGGWQFNGGGDRLKILNVLNWGTLNITTTGAFYLCSNLHISATDAPIISTTDLSYTFHSCTSLVSPNLSAWDVSGVTSLGNSSGSGVFSNCTALVNPDLSGWDTSNVTSMFALFYNCPSFNSPSISNWDVSSCTYFGYTSGTASWSPFALCASFNQPLNWTIKNTGSVYMRFMFYNCTAFNQDIGDWDVSAVTTMVGMFYGCTNFNQNLGTWNTGLVTDMSQMFLTCTAFNNGGSPDINNWNVSSCTNFGDSYDTGMFQICSSFNQPIGNWNTSSMQRAIAMFSGAISFNQNIGSWNTSMLTKVGGTSQSNWGMFYNATAFNQDISAWDVNQILQLSSFMTNVTLSTANYDALLIAWDAQGAMSFSGTVNFGGSKYTSGGAAQAARTSLISKWGGIVDGGAA